MHFRSSTFHKIDIKGRVIIPSRFKDLLEEDKESGTKGVMITNMDDCLFAYTFSEWDKLESRIVSAESTNMADFRRFFIGNSCKCLCDKQDRIRIPENLRKYAELKKDIVLAGNLNKFEIWDRENWDQVNKTTEIKLKQKNVKEELSPLRL